MGQSLRVGTSRLIVPNLNILPFEWRNGVKRFHLVAEEVNQELVSGVTVRAWGYNGSTPGPVIVVQEGDHIQIVLHNKLSEDTAIHWHGLIVPNNMDGVPEIGAGQVAKPGGETVYEFQVRQAGTFMYHSHVMNAKQEMMGLVGMLIASRVHLFGFAGEARHGSKKGRTT